MNEFKLPQGLSSGPSAAGPSAPPVQALMYEAPSWSSTPSSEFHYLFEVIVQGSVLQTISLDNQPFFLIGRAPICDIVLENDVRHPFPSLEPDAVRFRARGATLFVTAKILTKLRSTSLEHLKAARSHSVS